MKYSDTPERARKYHYWRGFKAASLVFVPIIVVLLVTANVLIDAIVK